MTPLRFAAYGACADSPNVVVDGSPNAGTVLVLSHWLGMPTPDHCAADTSCQMVFRYLDRGADLHDNARFVTNNHFDQDGLTGVYALTDPDDARRRRRQLEAVAAAGDFGVASDRTAARISMAISALADPTTSRLDLPDDYAEMCAVLYEHGLGVLPAWLDDPELCRPLWAAEDAQLDAGQAALAGGEVTIAEHPEVDLAVVTLPDAGRSTGHRFAGRSFTGIHPIALHAATDRTNLLTIDRRGGRHRLTCRYEGWVQFRSRVIAPRVDLAPLADQLTAAEPGGARWTSTLPADLTPELFTDEAHPASSLDPATLGDAVMTHLRTAPPAWDPYRVSG